MEGLQDAPRVLGSVAELAASNTGRKTVVADRNLVIDVGVGKVVGTLCHGTDKDADALLGIQAVDIAPDGLHLGVEAQRDLAAVRRQVVGDGVLDHTEELFLRVSRPDGKAVKQLHHETGEALESTGNADGRRDLDQDILGGEDVDLKFAGLVDRRVEEGQEALCVSQESQYTSDTYTGGI